MIEWNNWQTIEFWYATVLVLVAIVLLLMLMQYDQLQGQLKREQSLRERLTERLAHAELAIKVLLKVDLDDYRTILEMDLPPDGTEAADQGGEI